MIHQAPILPWRKAEVFGPYKTPEWSPFSAIFYSKLLVETCIPLGDVDIHTSCTSWLSVSFLQHAVCSGIGGVWHMTGVIGLLALEMTCSNPFSQKEALFATKAC